MNVEHVTGATFTLDLLPKEMKHLLSVSSQSPKRMIEILTLWCEIGFYTSTAIEKGLNEKCRQNNFPRLSSS